MKKEEKNCLDLCGRNLECLKVVCKSLIEEEEMKRERLVETLILIVFLAFFIYLIIFFR